MLTPNQKSFEAEHIAYRRRLRVDSDCLQRIFEIHLRMHYTEIGHEKIPVLFWHLDWDRERAEALRGQLAISRRDPAREWSDFWK